MTETATNEVAPEAIEAGDAQVVDVRTDGERAAGHIAGTEHVPFERLAEAAERLDRARPVVFYCRSGDRSAAAAQAFGASGWDASSLAGGIVAWVESGRPIDGEIIEPSSMPPA